MPISEEKLRENFARNLTYYRKALNLTQTDLAEKLNYSDKSISKWERGDGLPDLSVTAQLAEIFGLTVNDLIADKPRKRLMTTRNKIIITGTFLDNMTNRECLSIKVCAPSFQEKTLQYCKVFLYIISLTSIEKEI